MPNLLSPRHTVASDPASDRITLTFDHGDDPIVVELDSEAAPALINTLMRARTMVASV